MGRILDCMYVRAQVINTPFQLNSCNIYATKMTEKIEIILNNHTGSNVDAEVMCIDC